MKAILAVSALVYSTNAAYGVTGSVSDGGACLSAADCSVLTSNCCLIKDSTTVAVYQTFCVPTGVDTTSVSTTT